MEETPETKKSKEKSKKKKWSFRSISFSKKDKSKPNKDSEKNGEVKEVAEEVSRRFEFVIVFTLKESVW